MKKLILVRHGESQWNKENRFTGWADVPLSEKGENEAREAGRLIKNAGIKIDLAFSSVLKRAIKTQHLLQEEADQMWIPEVHHWRLNERHYGALQGLNKAETAAKYEVSAMPTFLFIKRGEVVDKLMGANPSALESMLEELA